MKPLDPRLLRYATAARGYVLLSGVIGGAQTLVILAFAWLLTDAVTGAIAGRDVSLSLGLLVGVAVLRGLLIAASDFAGMRAAAKVGTQLREAVLDAVAKRGPAWLAAQNQTALALTAGRGLEALDSYFSRYIPQLVMTVVATPILLAAVWWFDLPSGVIAIVALPLIPLFLIMIGIATKVVQRRQWQSLQRLAVRFADTVQGLSTLRLFRRELRAAERIEQDADDYRRETMKVLRFSFLSGFSMELLASLAVALIAVAVGFRLLSGELTLEVGLFVLLLAPEVFLPIRQVGVQFHAAAEGVAATVDVFEVLDGAVEEPGAARVIGAGADGGILTLADVRVRRGERQLPAATFTVRPGQITLLSGPSGVGKTSLLAAIRGAADYDGEITLGTAPVTLDALAWAGQKPGLMRGTIAENIALGDAEPDADGIRSALEAAGASDLDPARELGVQGAGLSGGQAQRVGVARALYRHARSPERVLLLDEPSSALDEHTEAQLWQSLRERADAGAAILLVSHRASARECADVVIELGATV